MEKKKKKKNEEEKQEENYEEDKVKTEWNRREEVREGKGRKGGG